MSGSYRTSLTRAEAALLLLFLERMESGTTPSLALLRAVNEIKSKLEVFLDATPSGVQSPLW